MLQGIFRWRCVYPENSGVGMWAGIRGLISSGSGLPRRGLKGDPPQPHFPFISHLSAGTNTDFASGPLSQVLAAGSLFRVMSQKAVLRARMALW